MFKILGVGVDSFTPLKAKPFHIQNAFFDIGGQKYKVGTKFQCDRPQGFCGALDIADAISAFQKDGPITIYFNRPPNGLDVSIVLAEMKADDTQQFLSCMIRLSEMSAKILESLIQSK